jgi:hypothetical protein
MPGMVNTKENLASQVPTLGKYNTPTTSKPPKTLTDMLFCCGKICFESLKNCYKLPLKTKN